MLWPHYLKALFVYLLVWYYCTVQAAGHVYTEYIMFQAMCVLTSLDQNAIAHLILLGSKNVLASGGRGYIYVHCTIVYVLV